MFLPVLMLPLVGAQQAATVGSALASVAIYVLMALVLIVRPAGLYGRV